MFYFNIKGYLLSSFRNSFFYLSHLKNFLIKKRQYFLNVANEVIDFQIWIFYAKVNLKY